MVIVDFIFCSAVNRPRCAVQAIKLLPPLKTSELLVLKISEMFLFADWERNLFCAVEVIVFRSEKVFEF